MAKNIIKGVAEVVEQVEVSYSPVVIETAKVTGVELTRVNQIYANYTPMLDEIAEKKALLETLDPKDPKDAVKAKRISIDLGKINGKATRQKADDKSIILGVGKCIDKAYNSVVGESKKLQDSANEIVNYAEKQETIRIANIQKEREALLEGLHEDPSSLKLGSMDDSLWAITLSGLKVSKQAKVEEEARLEKLRLEEEATNELRISRAESLKKYETSYAKLSEGKNIDLGTLEQSAFDVIFNACVEDAEAEIKKQKEIEEENIRLKAIAETERLAKEEATKRQTSFFEFDIQLSFDECLAMSPEEYKSKYDKAKINFKAETDRIYAEKKAEDERQAKIAEAARLAKEDVDKKAKQLAESQAFTAKLIAEKKAAEDKAKAEEAEKLRVAKELAKASVTVKMTAWLDEVQIRKVDTNTIKDPKIKQVTQNILNAFESFRQLAINEIGSL